MVWSKDERNYHGRGMLLLLWLFVVLLVWMLIVLLKCGSLFVAVVVVVVVVGTGI